MNAINLSDAIDVTATKAVEIIQATGGLWFRVDFERRTDGELRRMVCRIGVQSTGSGDREWKPEDKGLIQVWDAEIRNFRFVSVERIQGIRSQGRAYRVI